MKRTKTEGREELDRGTEVKKNHLLLSWSIFYNYDERVV